MINTNFIKNDDDNKAKVTRFSHAEAKIVGYYQKQLDMVIKLFGSKQQMLLTSKHLAGFVE